MDQPKKIEDLRVKIFVDGAEEASIVELERLPYIKGFTTNPSLMHQAGVTDYTAFAKKTLSEINGKCISFEVFSDDFAEMERQARIIHSWGSNVYVKIPITNTKGESSAPLIQKLSNDGIAVNATMIVTADQVRTVAEVLNADTPAIVSVFAGRIADAGLDPIPTMREAKGILAAKPKAELLWASCRELFNIYQAEEVGCEIITVPPTILKKIDGIGIDLRALSLEGVQKFYEDGKTSGFSL